MGRGFKGAGGELTARGPPPARPFDAAQGERAHATPGNHKGLPLQGMGRGLGEELFAADEAADVVETDYNYDGYEEHEAH